MKKVEIRQYCSILFLRSFDNLHTRTNTRRRTRTDTGARAHTHTHAHTLHTHQPTKQNKHKPLLFKDFKIIENVVSCRCRQERRRLRLGRDLTLAVFYLLVRTRELCVDGALWEDAKLLVADVVAVVAMITDQTVRHRPTSASARERQRKCRHCYVTMTGISIRIVFALTVASVGYRVIGGPTRALHVED